MSRLGLELAQYEMPEETRGSLYNPVLAMAQAKFEASLRRSLGFARYAVRELAGEVAPRTTDADRPSGEAMARLNASQGWASVASPHYLELVLGKKATEAQRRLAGAVMSERRLRYMELAYRELARHESVAAAAARSAGNPTEAAQAAARATEALQQANDVGTIVGQPNSPLATEAEYRTQLNSDFMKGVFERWKQHVVPVLNDLYTRAQGLDPADPIKSRTQIPGEPMNLKRLLPNDRPHGPPVVPGSPRGAEQRRLPFSRQATGANQGGYDIDLGAMIEHSLGMAARTAAQADLNRTMVENGLARWGKRYQGYELNGSRAVEFDVHPPKGTQEAAPGETVLYVDARAAEEYRRAMKLDTPFKLQSIEPGMHLLTRVALASSVEAVAHGKNLLSLGMRPFMLRNLPRNVIGVVIDAIKGDPNTQARIVELARINALKTERGFESMAGRQHVGGKWNPLYWTGRFLDGLQRVVRLTANDAFDDMVQRGLVENTETNRRNFINGAGNYDRASQNKMVAWLRETGIGPFATAATNFVVQGVRNMVLSPGVPATSTRAALQLRAHMLAKVLTVGAAVGLANYLLWGRPDGDDETPFGSIKVGESDGKTKHWNLGALTGVPRGMRAVGVLDVIEGNRRGQTSGQIVDKAAFSMLDALIHPFMGPPGQFAYTAATGRGHMGHQVAATPPKGGSKMQEQVIAAAIQANPAVAAFMGSGSPESRKVPGMEKLENVARDLHPGYHVPLDEALWKLLGPYGVKYRSSARPQGRKRR